MLLPVLFLALLFSWQERLDDGEKLWGIFQGDMPTYLANARHTASSTLYLTYSSPYDVSDSKDAFLIQLPVTLLSLLLKLGFSEATASFFLTFVFGSMMFYFLYQIVAHFMKHLFSRWVLYLLLSLGGGLAWISALSDQTVSFWSGIQQYESNYYWWFFNLFRNLLYPFELIHHVIFFGLILALMKREWGKVNLLVILSLLVNPFLALHMLLVTGAVALVDKETSFKKKFLFLPFALLWALYYKFFLPLSPVFKSLIDQHQGAYSSSIDTGDLFQAFGFGLLGLFLLIDRNLKKKIVQNWVGIPVVALALSTFVLVHNGVLQPLHFERGYLFMSLWILTFYWFQEAWIDGKLKKGFFRGLLVFFLVTSLPDNISFVRDMYLISPDKNLLVFDSQRVELLNYLKNLKSPQKILSVSYDLNRQIAASTHHQVFFGTEYTTPDFQGRLKEMNSFFQHMGKSSENPVLDKTELVILPKDKEFRLSHESWKSIWASQTWEVFKRI